MRKLKTTILTTCLFLFLSALCLADDRRDAAVKIEFSIPMNQFGIGCQPGQKPSYYATGYGRGVIVGDDIILTADHVIDGATKFNIIFSDGTEIKNVRIVERDPYSDLAVLKCDVPDDLPVAEIADEQKPEGIFYVFGNKDYEAECRYDARGFWWCDSECTQGDSGGPIYNDKNELVGIVSGGSVWVKEPDGGPKSCWPLRAGSLESIKGILTDAGYEDILTKAVEKVEFLEYEKAYNVAMNSGQPLIVVFSATWCPPCQKMKKDVLIPMMKSGQLDDYLVAYVDIDKQPSIYRKWFDGNVSIPAVMVFKKTEDGWKYKHKKGYQSEAGIRGLITW